MSEEDLELLITLDDPEGAPEEDRFNHLPVEKYPGVLARPAAQQGDDLTNERKPTGK
jgi:hypothetical protein